MDRGAFWIFALFLVVGLVWAWRRGRAGYHNVQALMAQVEAHASADARAAAVASNTVNVGGFGPSRGNDDYLQQLDYDYLAAAVARHLAGGATDRVDALGTGLRPGAGDLLPRDAVRHQGGALNGWTDPWGEASASMREAEAVFFAGEPE